MPRRSVDRLGIEKLRPTGKLVQNGVHAAVRNDDGDSGRMVDDTAPSGGDPTVKGQELLTSGWSNIPPVFELALGRHRVLAFNFSPGKPVPGTVGDLPQPGIDFNFDGRVPRNRLRRPDGTSQRAGHYSFHSPLGQNPTQRFSLRQTFLGERRVRPAQHRVGIPTGPVADKIDFTRHSVFTGNAGTKADREVVPALAAHLRICWARPADCQAPAILCTLVLSFFAGRVGPMGRFPSS